MKMVTQLITKRLSNFKTYYFVIPPCALQQNPIVKMIFCKRRIGVLNFSGYFNRKRTRRWRVDVHYLEIIELKMLLPTELAQ